MEKQNPDGTINEIHTYEEPLLEGINDRDTLSRIVDETILERVHEVRVAYQMLRSGEIDTREFYRISGIRFSDNPPLIINKDDLIPE